MIVQAGGGTEINYVTRGRGPVCLVLSSIGTKPYERQLPPALDEHLTLAFVDVRGSGRSTGNGHQPFVEEPERFTAALTAWLGALRSG